MTRVAIQGVKGSYSEEAVREFFGRKASLVECHDFHAAFAAVRLRKADKAVIPVRNKIVGEIRPAIDLLESSRYTVLEKISLKIRHVLAATPEASFEDITSVSSHPEALKQCRNFLAANPALESIAAPDTASSIRRIVRDADPTKAAIGSPRAARLYGAKILRENIADDIDNWTVFYLIGS